MAGRIILTGDRPTGRLHIGHYVGSLKNRVAIQNAGGYDNIVRNFFVASFDLNLGFLGDKANPVVIDLYMVKFALGLGLKINVVSIVGMVLAIYIMKWSGER